MKNPKLGQLPLTSVRSLFDSTFSKPKMKLGEIIASTSIDKSESNNIFIRLKDLSITTFEEVLAIARVKPNLLSDFLNFDTRLLLPEAQSLKKFASVDSSKIIDLYPEYEQYQYSFGASRSREPVTMLATMISDVQSPPKVLPGREISLIGNCMPPIKNQGDRGTCVAFATCAVVEYAYCRDKNQKVDFSEQYQFWNCKQYDGVPHEDGTFPRISFQLIKDSICKEDIWNYNPTSYPTNISQGPPPFNVKVEARKYRANQVITIANFRDVVSLKKYLCNNQPVSIAIPVFDSWEENANSRITGNITLPFPGEEVTAGHAMVLVGYEDNEDFAGGGFFIVRNSWGTTEWGVQCPFGSGYGTIPYRYIEKYNDSAHVVVV